jgi:REP element-mobilizing transposase RayT
MQLSVMGQIADQCWQAIPDHFPNVLLDEYIIMPNHMHAIVIINKTQAAQNPVPAQKQSEFFRKPRSLSSFIAGFKSAVNSKIDDYIDRSNLNIPKYNRHNQFFQSNYHDRLIRNNEEYRRIKKYIIDNPLKWKGENG